jgi:hypothetical protein
LFEFHAGVLIPFADSNLVSNIGKYGDGESETGELARENVGELPIQILQS